MEAIDATEHKHTSSTSPPPSLLSIILDTSPPAWSQLESSLPLSAVLKTILIFTNAHLAINHANKVAVLASHVDSVQWLYPTPLSSQASNNPTNGTTNDSTSKATNKYRPFLTVEQELRSNLSKLLSTTPPSPKLSAAPLLSAAISTALTYTNMSLLQSEPISTSDPSSTSLAAGAGDLDAHTSAARRTAGGPSMVGRILVVSVSSADLSSQYIALMNGVFAAQRLNVPIDILRLGPRTAFLQQASDATGGVFMTYEASGRHASNGNGVGQDPGGSDVNAATAGLLQTLLMGFLPDVTARRLLIPAGSAEVDFRAACFCHGKVVSIGGVCSVCLSIFCIPLPAGTENCPTCQSALRIPKSISLKPAVVSRKKKKKKKGLGLDGRETPGLTSGAGTPAQNGTPNR